MVQKYVMIRADDISGEERDVELVEFSYRGQTFSVDLGPKNRRKFEKALEPFIDAAKASSTVRAIRSSTRVAKKPDGPTVASQIRQWAAAHNIDVPPRGRIPKSVVSQYDEYESKRVNVG
jgi:hypothetical protein